MAATISRIWRMLSIGNMTVCGRSCGPAYRATIMTWAGTVDRAHGRACSCAVLAFQIGGNEDEPAQIPDGLVGGARDAPGLHRAPIAGPLALRLCDSRTRDGNRRQRRPLAAQCHARRRHRPTC